MVPGLEVGLIPMALWIGIFIMALFGVVLSVQTAVTSLLYLAGRPGNDDLPTRDHWLAMRAEGAGAEQDAAGVEGSMETAVAEPAGAAKPAGKGFFAWVKQKLGIGGVSVKLRAPGQVPKDGATLEGTATFTTKSAQHVEKLDVELIEVYTTGRGDEKKQQEISLGKCEVVLGWDIAPGETKEVPFELPFKAVKSGNDMLKERGGVLGGLGKLASMAQNEQSEYRLKISADVRGTTFGPVDSLGIRLV